MSRRSSSILARNAGSSSSSPYQVSGPVGRFCITRNSWRFCIGASGPSSIETVVSSVSHAYPPCSKTNTLQRGSRRSRGVRTRPWTPLLHSLPSTRATPTRTGRGNPLRAIVIIAAEWLRSRKSPGASPNITAEPYAHSKRHDPIEDRHVADRPIQCTHRQRTIPDRGQLSRGRPRGGRRGDHGTERLLRSRGGEREHSRVRQRAVEGRHRDSDGTPGGAGGASARPDGRSGRRCPQAGL